MEWLLYFYIGFSYLFMLGAKMENERMPLWNFLLAPIVMPVSLGVLSNK
jgi:hypothetical protein